MGWLQTKIGRFDDVTTIQDAVGHAHQADSAKRGQVDFAFALFVREPDDESQILLLSPNAAAYLPVIPGQWTESQGPADHNWGMLYGDIRSPGLLGVGPRPKA